MLVGSLLCSLHCSGLGSYACCLARCPTGCSADCCACLLIGLIIGMMRCSAHRCARLLVALLVCLLCFLFLGSCSSCPLLPWLVRIWSGCCLVHCSTRALPLCSLLCSFALRCWGFRFCPWVWFRGFGALLLPSLLVSLGSPDVVPRSAWGAHSGGVEWCSACLAFLGVPWCLREPWVLPHPSAVGWVAGGHAIFPLCMACQCGHCSGVTHGVWGCSALCVSAHFPICCCSLWCLSMDYSAWRTPRCAACVDLVALVVAQLVGLCGSLLMGLRIVPISFHVLVGDLVHCCCPYGLICMLCQSHILYPNY